MNNITEVRVGREIVQLGRKIGQGGEGEVYAVGNDPTKAIKIYNSERRSSREPKVIAMVREKLSNQSKTVAFPIEIVKYKDGSFAGFVMNLALGCKPLFELYAPAARKSNFPKADFRFLVRVATNIARAIASVHQSGCVIGDINHSGILISKNATVVLIDADSFQVIHSGNKFLCHVGVPEYTPPELHKMDLSKVERTPNHDAFGLAVVIFQLLFMGRHPFIGTVRSGESPQIADAIKDLRFVYAENRNVGMDQPPGTPSLSDFTPTVAQNFERAFSKEALSSRPTANSWVKALEELERTLSKCSANVLHYYPSPAVECPWCFMDKRLGMSLFTQVYEENAHNSVSVDPGEAGFILQSVWRQIEAFQPLSASMFEPKLDKIEVSVSKKAQEEKRGSLVSRFLGAIGVVGAGAGFVSNPDAWFFWIPIGWWGASALFGETKVNKQPYIFAFEQAEEQWQDAHLIWLQRCGIQEYRDLDVQLRSARSRYEKLGGEEKTQIEQYIRNRRSIQLQSYLASFQIRRASIRGIGPAKEATLASYGIETAADVDEMRILRVPGFGPATTQPLLDWRKEKERRFVYNTQPTSQDTFEISQIRNAISTEKSQLRKLLSSGVESKKNLLKRIEKNVNVQDPKFDFLSNRREQARMDLKFLNIAEPVISPRKTAPKISVQAIVQNNRPLHRPQPQSQSNYPNPKVATKISCPRCGADMIKRYARHGKNAGSYFWGCSRYPNCRGSRN